MTTPTPESTGPQFVEELNVCLNIETSDAPVFRGARVYAKKIDYNSLTLTVNGEGDAYSGVYLFVSEDTGEVSVELFAGDNPEKALAFALRGGEWFAVKST